MGRAFRIKVRMRRFRRRHPRISFAIRSFMIFSATFGAAYGFEFIAPQGVSTETEASARDVAKIIRQIRAQKIPAVFLENVTDPRLLQRIADETGAKIGGTIYSDALSNADGPASTYIDMMRHNIRELSAALTS